MTLSSTTSKVSYNGDGATASFSINFVFWDSEDLEVTLRAADGTETTWVEGTQYTVSGGNGSTGTLTVKTTPTDYTPASGEKLVIRDKQSELQEDSLPLSGSFPSTVVEQRLDKITRLIQIHSEEIARSILLPVSTSLSGLVLPEPGAGELLRYNGAGTDLETVAAGDLATAIDTLFSGLADNDFLYYEAAGGVWKNIVSGVTGRALLAAASAAAARTELGLGTAATKNVGVSNGQVPQMDATGYPAADASQITNAPLPRGHIDGLILSNGTDADHDIDIAAGACRDSADAVNISLSAITKQIDATWSAGDNAGGLSSSLSAPANNTWYHVFAIVVGGSADVGFDTSVTAANLVSDHSATAYRRIGAVLTDGSANIIAFSQYGDEFLWDTPPLDVDIATTLGTTARLDALSVPTGVKVWAKIVPTTNDATANTWIYISSPDVADSAPTSSLFTLNPGASSARNSVVMDVRTDTSAQIRSRASGTIDDYKVSTLGWTDPRGRNE